MKTLSARQLRYIGVILGAVYGLFARFVFGFGDAHSDTFAVMTLSFVFLVPIALGFITVWCGEHRAKYGWARRILMPWSASLLFLAGCLVLVWEGVICIVLLLPLILVLSSLGGMLAWLIRPLFKSDRSRTSCVAVIALLPFAAAPLEHLRALDAEIRTVDTQIDIRADQETVWREIRTVPRIRPEEHSFDFSHVLGFPRPVEARLVGTGVGAVRYASFERGVLFVETITEWREPKRLSFSIRADTKHIPPTTFDEHVKVGGPYFDVLEGTYELEELGGGVVRLHLSSRQRLSTHFNFYSHLWTDYLMADLQNYILRIVKRRCENDRAGEQAARGPNRPAPDAYLASPRHGASTAGSETPRQGHGA